VVLAVLCRFYSINVFVKVYSLMLAVSKAWVLFSVASACLCSKMKMVWAVKTKVSRDTRGIQQVYRLTQLITAYVQHILSLFNVVRCSWNGLGPAFLESYNSDVEELLIVLFYQPFAMQIALSSLANLCPLTNFFLV